MDVQVFLRHEVQSRWRIEYSRPKWLSLRSSRAANCESYGVSSSGMYIARPWLDFVQWQMPAYIGQFKYHRSYTLLLKLSIRTQGSVGHFHLKKSFNIQIERTSLFTSHEQHEQRSSIIVEEPEPRLIFHPCRWFVSQRNKYVDVQTMLQ